MLILLKVGKEISEFRYITQSLVHVIENQLKPFDKALLMVPDDKLNFKNAGYDAIQVHSAHGYLLSQFLSARVNKRTDNWGESIENRSRLLISVYNAVRKAVGNDYPVFVKINGSDDPYEGFPVEEAIEVIITLVKEGIDVVEISGMKSTRPIKEEEEGYYVTTGRMIILFFFDTRLRLKKTWYYYQKLNFPLWISFNMKLNLIIINSYSY
jgi:hypothetical protein